MAPTNAQKKATNRLLKVAKNKVKPKSGLSAIEHFVKTVDKYKLDFS